MDLEQQAIENIKLGAQMSEQYYNEPIICTYSGGKDSDVLLDLFIKSGVDFVVHNSHTTVDAPQTVYHIRKKFKKLEDMGIKTKIIYPIYKGKRTSMWDLIVEKGSLPTRIARFCCQVLKETSNPNRIIATGIRKDESSQRSTRGEIEYIANQKKDSLNVSREQFLDFDNTVSRRIIERCVLKSRTAVNPIINWKHRDVWEYIHSNNIEYNPLYDMGYHRVGCVGCPMATYKQKCKEFADFPKYKENYLKAIDKMLERKKAKGKEMPWKTAQDCFDWWIEEEKMQGQVSLFDEE